MTDSLGLESDVIRLVAYDARWPGLFAAERQRIQDACGLLALRLEHVGGTAIPGMCTKPVLDIVAGHPSAVSVEDCVAALQRAGYEPRGDRGVPGRQFLCRGQPRAYHVHLVEAGGPLWREYLAFRNYLRAHPNAARQFAEVKRALAALFPRDREGYVNAKSTHVQDILGLAVRAPENGGAGRVPRMN